MEIKDGQNRLSPKKQQMANCFFCLKDTEYYFKISWPQIVEIYEYKKLQPPSAICCDECYKKPGQSLYSQFRNYLISQEIIDYQEGHGKLITTEAECNTWLDTAKELGSFEDVANFVEKYIRK